MYQFKCSLKPKHKALEHVFQGLAVGCGSHCFQDSTGSQFLGHLPDAAVSELLCLRDSAYNGVSRTRTVRTLDALIEYVGAV